MRSYAGGTVHGGHDVPDRVWKDPEEESVGSQAAGVGQGLRRRSALDFLQILHGAVLPGKGTSLIPAPQ